MEELIQADVNKEHSVVFFEPQVVHIAGSHVIGDKMAEAVK